MANDKLMTYDQGESIKTKLTDIANNISNINKNIELPSSKITTMQNYTKGSSTASISPSDSLNQAVAKLENRTDVNENNILSLSALIPKVVSSTYPLNDLTWTTGVDGMIYSNAAVVSGITSIYSAIITGFSRLRATDVIVPILSNDGTQIRFMANTDSWITDAYVTLRIVGI